MNPQLQAVLAAIANDGGGVAPLYGGPAPQDSGSGDAGSDGNPGLRYGAPPPSRDA